jgi:predicted dehydrogenase
MDVVRMGIVGSGYMGRTYAQCVSKHNEGVELVAVSKGSRAPRLVSDYGIDHIPDYTTMLDRDDIDAVFLAAPHHLHAEETISAAPAASVADASVPAKRPPSRRLSR